MSKILLIPIDKGYKYDSIDESAQVIKLVEITKDIREEIQSVDDIFRLNNTTKEAFELKWKNFETHEIGNAFEVLMVAAYNQGKLPDFTNGTSKYYPIFRMGSPSGVGFSYHDCDDWPATSDVGARLVFHGENAKENMLDAVTKFEAEYKKSRTT